MASLKDGFELRVDEAAFKTAVTAMNSRIREMKASYDGVIKIAQNTGKYWIGLAGDEHRRAFLDQQDEIETILKRLSEHPVDLQKISGIYVEAENEVAEASSSVVLPTI